MDLILSKLRLKVNFFVSIITLLEIFPNDITISYHQLFFSPKDTINIARKKWYDYLGNDYKFFWDVYSNIIQITKLSIYNITKLNDIKGNHLVYKSNRYAISSPNT